MEKYWPALRREAIKNYEYLDELKGEIALIQEKIARRINIIRALRS